MLVEVVGIEKNEDCEIGRVAENTTDLETACGGGMNGRGRTKVVKTSKLQCSIRLKFIDTFRHKSPD